MCIASHFRGRLLGTTMVSFLRDVMVVVAMLATLVAIVLPA